MPETELEKAIKKKPRTEAWGYKNRVKPLLKELNQISPCRYNRIENCAGPDYPDLDCTCKGINFKLEMKVAKGRNGRMVISDGQFEWHRRENRAGGNAYLLAYWVDKDELHMFKAEEGKHKIMDYANTRLIQRATDLIP